MTHLNRRIVTVATGQRGRLTRADARRIGASDDQLRSRVSSGFLERVGPDLFRLAGAPTDPRSLLTELILDIGGDVVACRDTAAALHGFDGWELTPPFDLAVGRGRHVNRIGHRIHTVVSLPLIDRTTIGSIPVTRGARTLIDLARSHDAVALTTAYDSGLRDGLFTERSLHARIVALRRQGRHGVPRLLRTIEGIEATRGAHSWLEREFLRLVAAARLPRPTTQAVLTKAQDRLVRVDFVWPDTDVVVEVLGYTWHRTKEHLARDTARSNALLVAGYRPYQFTYQQIVSDPDAVIADVANALGRRHGRRQPA